MPFYASEDYIVQELSDLHDKTMGDIAAAPSAEALYELKVAILGKKGQLTEALKGMGRLPPAERPKMGERINEIKTALESAFETRNHALESAKLATELAHETLDVSLPGTCPSLGRLHPLTRSMERISEFFRMNGFGLATGPQIEDEFHNFTALNTPDHHPARASHDTFYFGDGRLLRTQTSSVQIRFMEENSPPCKIISMGRVYRCDYDPTHSPMFHQLEGLWVDESIHFGHLKGLIQAFLKYFFEEEVKIRFRPSYFPFTEPSAEVDVWFNGRWLEILGCGMVHPKVFENVKVNPQRFQGLAFGMGIERLSMVRYGITDLRLLFENDIRFLQQF